MANHSTPDNINKYEWSDETLVNKGPGGGRYNYDVHTWDVIDRYFDEQSSILAHNQIDSYNDFIESIIPTLIKKDSPIAVEAEWDPNTRKYGVRYEVEFDNIYMSLPQINEGSGSIRKLHPHEARLRGLTYSANLHLDITHRIIRNGQVLDEKKEPKISFKIPAMVKSKLCYLQNVEDESLIEMGECPYDLGGYFIINGSEKVIISQERPVDNKVLCFPQKASNSKFDEVVEIRSTIDQRFYPVRNNTVTLTRPKEGESDQFLRVNFPYLTREIPLVVLFRAIGITTDKEIMQLMLLSELETTSDNVSHLIIPSLEEIVEMDGKKRKIYTQHDALIFISRHVSFNLEYLDKKLGTRATEEDKLLAKTQYISDILRRELLPHCGPDFYQKALFLGYMTKRLIDCKLGDRDHDIRDHYANKRLDLSGPKLKQIFHSSFGRMVKEIKNKIHKTMEDTGATTLNNSLRKIIQNCPFQAPLKKALSTGDWGTSKNSNMFSSTNLGIAQVLQRLSYIGYVSHLRRVQTPMEKAGGKITEPRKLHPSQAGILCPNETPEGQQVGIVKNLSLMTSVTISSTTLPIKVALDSLGMKQIQELDRTKAVYLTKIFLNGEWLGVTDKPEVIYDNLKELKVSGSFSIYTGIYWYHEYREIDIRCDGGRYNRPLYVVQRYGDQYLPKIAVDWTEASTMPWKALIRGGYIEYIDPEESENCLIAMNMKVLADNKTSNDNFKPFTHLEMHCGMWNGAVAQMIPFSDHNPGPRNCYQCLWKEEEVVMIDRSLKKIKDIKIGDQVISVDPKTYSEKISTVINQFVKSTDKSIIKLETLSGRELVCTDDHPVLTYNGWKKAGNLSDNDLICVNLNQTNYQLDNNDLIISLNNFRAILKKLDVKESLINRHANKLVKLGLLPLYGNSSKVPILARIYGFLLTDGSTNIYRNQPQIQICFGSYEGGLDFLSDVTNLGFAKNKLAECVGKVHGVVHHGWQLIYNNELASLLISLGCALGKKTETSAPPLPNWLKHGSKLTKREFLAGFQGGDGCKIRFNYLKNRSSPNFILNATSQQKCEKYLKSLVYFMNEIKNLFDEFGIICKNVTSKKYNKHDDRYTVILPFDCSKNNIINYFERIGYRYDHHKKIESLPVYEYLKYNQTLTVDKLKQRIINLRENGKTYAQVGRELEITEKKASDLYGSRHMTSRVPNNHMGKWLETIKIKSNSIFVPLKSIKSMPNVEIADITVDSNCHSFITSSGIVVHNSSMGKQALGLFCTNYNSRMDTMAHVLCYPQRPLVLTRTMKYLRLDKLPHGQQCVVGVACYSGYNQEDSVLMNKGAIERGKFNSLYYKTYVDEMNPHKSSTSESEQFGIPGPDTTQIRKHGSYEHLDENGFAKIGSQVQVNDIIIGKMVKLREPIKRATGGLITHSDVSTQLKTGDDGFVDKRIPSASFKKNFNSDNNPFAKIRISQYRQPVIGDKVACYSEDTEVRTEKGWKFMKNVTLKDKLLDCRRKGKTSYRHPTAIHHYDTNAYGELYHIQGKGIDLLVTPNHRLFVKDDDDDDFQFHQTDRLRSRERVTYLLDTKKEICLNHQQSCRIIKSSQGVYCVSMPSGLVLVRRQGSQPVWCGNSRHAQKGTVGLILPEEDMPFSDSGLVPDLIMNPHALPSRMTIGQWIESVLGKSAALEGEVKDATPFTHFNKDDMGRELEKFGFHKDGEEILYNGYTGQMLRVSIFVGVTYYQRLKHMVKDKVHARSTGRVNNLTKQSVEGRGVGGGLRLGEMERDCFIAHGISQFLKERFMDSADKFRVYVGKESHTIIVANPDIDLYMYNDKQMNSEDAHQIQIPHAMKLLLHELISMGNDVRLFTE